MVLGKILQMESSPIDLTSPVVQVCNQRAQQESITLLTSDSDEAECEEGTYCGSGQGEVEVAQTPQRIGMDHVCVRAEGSGVDPEGPVLVDSPIVHLVDEEFTPNARGFDTSARLPVETPDLMRFIESRLGANAADGESVGVVLIYCLAWKKYAGMRSILLFFGGCVLISDGELIMEYDGQGQCSIATGPKGEDVARIMQ